ncbi:MAG: helix-turn-helix domain-containing protein [Oscillospiraceae bacterium]|nr:helix-turn-helix domain-containing protein [Oscillospiraceae bacterium]
MFSGERLAEIRKLRGWSQERLGEVIGVSRSAINKYEVGVVTEVKASQVELMAEALGCSAAYLVCWTDDPSIVQKLSPAEVKLVAMYRELNEEGQEKAAEYLQMLDESGKYKKAAEPRLVQKEA